MCINYTTIKQILTEKIPDILKKWGERRNKSSEIRERGCGGKPKYQGPFSSRDMHRTLLPELNFD